MEQQIRLLLQFLAGDEASLTVEDQVAFADKLGLAYFHLWNNLGMMNISERQLDFN